MKRKLECLKGFSTVFHFDGLSLSVEA